MKEFSPISSQKELFQFMNLFFILLPGKLKGSGCIFSINFPLSLLSPRKRALRFSSCRLCAATPWPSSWLFPGFNFFQAFLVLGDPKVQGCTCGLSEEEELLTTDLLFCCRCSPGVPGCRAGTWVTCWPPGSPCTSHQGCWSQPTAFQWVQPRHRALHLSFKSSMKFLSFHSPGPFPVHCSGWCHLQAWYGDFCVSPLRSLRHPLKRGSPRADSWGGLSGFWVVS